MREEFDDIELISRFKKGERSAFDQLVLKYQDRIYTLCRYILGKPQDAEDAAQDTFVKAFQNLKRFTPTSSFYTWLYRIAVNTCLDHKRKASLRSIFFTAHAEEYLVTIPSDNPSPETMYEGKQSMDALMAALSNLSKKLRVVIVLKDIDGLSYEEIAGILNLSVGTVKSRIFRARESLKKRTEKFGEQK
jgi:RNA polymerase sigma-70 factor, ECF subfamily